VPLRPPRACPLRSNAIVRHLARVGRLGGASESDAATLDMLVEQLMDLRNLVVRVSYTPAADFALAMSRFADTDCAPAHLASFEAFLKHDWLLASGISVADAIL
jgi:hypothetical protein